MVDSRIKRLAKILVYYSTNVQKGEYVQICGYDYAKPLITEVYKEVLHRGGIPKLRLTFEDLAFYYYNIATQEQLRHFPDSEMHELYGTQVSIGIGGSNNTRQLSSVDAEKISLRQKTLQPISDYTTEHTRWVIARFPTNAQAQEADMSLQEFEKFLYKACLVDWTEESKNQDKIKEVFDKGDIVRIIGKDTDLSFSIKGRLGIKCDGHMNMPDGEVFYAPIENSAQGKIVYTYPAIRTGKEVDGIVLEFRDGRVVKATATKNEDFLIEMLDIDSDARLIGEFGIGTNYEIDRFINNLLFDEKIGGTIHIAVGRAYKESGGKSKSAIHWDMIKDLRLQAGGGAIFVDGKLVQKNGVWVFK